jgi:ribosomal protein S18 acetylase RimI-like enzyme
MILNMSVIIQEITNSDEKSVIAEKIIRQLPDWFELEDGIVGYVNGVKNKPFFIVFNNDESVGFISVKNQNQWTSEIYVMGILPKFRNSGIGRKLVDYIWNENRKSGRKYLIVKTLDESAEDKFYKETRGFYEKVGFTPLFTTTEIWGEENPCLIMIKDG